MTTVFLQVHKIYVVFIFYSLVPVLYFEFIWKVSQLVQFKLLTVPSFRKFN